MLGLVCVIIGLPTAIFISLKIVEMVVFSDEKEVPRVEIKAAERRRRHAVRRHDPD